MTDHRINLTLHKLDEFLSGEIHEDMNESSKTERTKFKITTAKLMNSKELLQIGSKILKTKKISSYSIDLR